MTVRVRPEAQNDILAAALWYAVRQPGLGAIFVDEVDATFQRIESGPLRYAVVHGRFRRALLRRFPYAVYFEPENPDVIVLAVLHQRRSRQVLDRRS